MLKQAGRFIVDLFIKPLNFIVKSARAAGDFFSKFKLPQLAGMGLNVIYIISVIPSLIEHANEIGWAIGVILYGKNNPALLEEWKEKHAGKTPGSHLFYESLKCLVCFIYIPIAVGEIYAIAAGASLAFTLPITLTIGYALFMAYEVICLFELSDQCKRLKRESETLGHDPQKLAANAQKRKELQNEMVTKSVSLFLLGAGLVCGLIGLGLFGISALGLVAGSPVLLGVSIAIFAVKIVNYFLPKIKQALFSLKNWISEIFSPSPNVDLIEINMPKIAPQNGVHYGNVTDELVNSSGVSKGQNDVIVESRNVEQYKGLLGWMLNEDPKKQVEIEMLDLKEDQLNRDLTGGVGVSSMGTGTGG